MALLQKTGCILLGSADVDPWSNSVDWCGSNFYDPHTFVDWTRRGPQVWEQHCGAGLATQEALPPLPSSTRRRRWLNRRGGGATPSRTGHIHGPYKWRSEVIIGGLHCSCVWSVPASSVRVLRCVRVRYRAISGRHDIARLTNPRSISWYRVIDINCSLVNY